jgi:hypothetical protein
MQHISVSSDVAQNNARSGWSAIGDQTTSHESWPKSINARRGIEKVFVWIKQWGGLCQFKMRVIKKMGTVFGLHVNVYNLIRLCILLRAAKVEAAWTGSRPEVWARVSAQRARMR